jgi:26S proteasome regulatory subunit N3
MELNQPRFLLRAIRQNVSIRKNINSAQLRQIIDKYIPIDSPLFNVMKETYVAALPASTYLGAEEEKEATNANTSAAGDDLMDLDESGLNLSTSQIGVRGGAVLTVLPEVEVYIYTLVLTSLLRHAELVNAAVEAATILIDRIRTFNRRSLDIFSSKAYFYYSLAYERVNALDKARPTLLALYRTASVRRDEIGQAVLINLLLRNYLHYNLYDQAHVLSMRTSFPESASNNQFCRYLYYLGRILAVQLEYGEAFQRLMMALRKAPQESYASGFSREVTKLLIIVQLLMGEIPERSIFNPAANRNGEETGPVKNPLKAYLELTQAVRQGDLPEFNKIVERYSAAFQEDGNYTLVQRLGHNVLKIGLKKISLSYTRISLMDIATKLHLPSIVAAEYICAKAIRYVVVFYESCALL